MPYYEYLCPKCGLGYTSPERGNYLTRVCDCGFADGLKRVWAVNFGRVMHSHFNRTVGKPISSMSQMRSELSRASDEATENTGIEHRYVPIDLEEARPHDH